MKKYYVEKFEKKVETFSVEELNNFILLRYWEKERVIDKEIIEYLKIRQRKLNETFEWTAENREKLLRLNEKYIACWEKLRAEALCLVQDLKKRIDKNDSFLHDFEIEAKVTSNIYAPDEDGDMCSMEDCIEEVLFIALGKKYFSTENWAFINSIDCLDNNNLLYLNPEQNWSKSHCFKGHFDNDFISQAIHDLYDHTCLSFPDILRINSLWAELQILHQHITEF